MPTSLAFFEPGHFHAALTLKTRNPRVAETVHLYARPGPERDGFVALIEAFNSRDVDPTTWQLVVHAGKAPLAALLNDGLADAVILAGNNAAKLETIAALHAAGTAVLADKPWLTSPAALPHLAQATAGLPLAMDIMTERHDTLARLRHALVNNAEVFGEFACDDPDGAAIEIGSKHHLYKRVNGQPLVRPAWYYDVSVQGDGLVDIQSHMTDQMQWLVGGDEPFDLDRDVTDLVATRWTTPVDADLFRESTGLDDFPASLAPWIEDGVLALPCNSLVRYRLRGVPVQQRAEWGQREPEGSGDIHAAHLRGTRAELIVEHGPQTDFVPQLHLRPRAGGVTEATLRTAVEAMQPDFPGLDISASPMGFRFEVPDAIRSTHEGNFAAVLNEFLDELATRDWPAERAARIRMRYALLARAKQQVDGE